MNSQESVQKKTSGRPPAGVWNFFNRGPFVKGHCSGTCNECGSFWACAKPVDLEEHLALDCPTQNKDVIDFYTQIIANRQGHGQAASQENIPSVEPSKKKHKITRDQATLSEFLESTKLTPQRECNINSALIKAFIICRLLNTEIIKVNQSIKNILEKATNLTLGLDGWTDPCETLQDCIQQIFDELGVDKFGAIVTDGGSNCTVAKRLISEQYPHILNLQYQNAHLFNNKTGKIVKTYIKSSGFFDNILDISNILKPISDTIMCLESKMANLADCYLGYIKLAIAIKNIFQDHHLMFYQKCVSIFNERFHAFDYDEYLLAYYLHPKYRGTGIKQLQFARVAGIAGRLWTKMIGSKIKKADLEILKAQLHKYTCNEELYNGSYWKATGDGTKDKLCSLSSLAVKLFSVRPHAASLKISSYLISNAKQELHYYGLELTEEEIQTVFQDIDLFYKDEEKENFDDLDESEDLIDSDIEDQNLEIENLIALNNIESNNDDENINDNNNNLNEDLNNEEIEEFDEDQFGAEFESMLDY
ncbi:hypothetical protein C2G38_2167033 [Gigaspora rosea]|uniref:DUF659 domain-containing protein n=1 Tax=Gigaspora rosea TaxID=44941 RepID=A0A397VT95_9GLOM|nr:hypothetical protein C2G38_2167033 [Gigaspora rosea]